MVDLSFLIVGILIFLRILSFLIVIRVLMSWFTGTQGGITSLVVDLTEPVLSLIRNAIPRGQGPLSMVDWSPLLALLIIDFLRYFIVVYLQ